MDSGVVGIPVKIEKESEGSYPDALVLGHKFPATIRQRLPLSSHIDVDVRLFAFKLATAHGQKNISNLPQYISPTHASVYTQSALNSIKSP